MRYDAKEGVRFAGLGRGLGPLRGMPQGDEVLWATGKLT